MYSRTNLPTQDDIEEFQTTYSNWGRWGDDDQLGALNLITPEVRKRAAAAVRHGESVSCSRPVLDGPGMSSDTANGGVARAIDVRPTGSSERLQFVLHGGAFTHLDALTHAFWDGKMYGGHKVDEIDPAVGPAYGSVAAAADGLVTRGVFLDIPGVRGVDWLENGDAIFPEDLDAAEERQGIKLLPGDSLVLHTGAGRRFHEKGIWPEGGQAGLHAACIPWLHERGVSYLTCDTGNDVYPSGYPDIHLPVHRVALVSMGVWLIDNCDLEACRRTAERLQQWEFLLSVSPIRFPVGTSGSPVNPIATF